MCYLEETMFYSAIEIIRDNICLLPKKTSKSKLLSDDNNNLIRLKLKKRISVSF